MSEQLSIIIVPHTHWDREWYQTFQQFRIRLVRTIDKLLDVLDSDAQFSYFMLDGQTIVLDDYLEVQPEQEERLESYTKAGRVLVGPWYVQPDEFLVSGESLIRNLQIGIQRANEFGNLMSVGYMPDTFGHIAQMPQIFLGFGIDNAVFWRGVGEEAHRSEFYWEGPDGSRVLTVHLADPMGYSNARQMPLNPEEFVTRVELLTSNILPKATTDTLLFMNGSDHVEPQEGLPAVIASANTRLAHLDPRHEQLLYQRNQQNVDGGESKEEGKQRHYNSIHLQIGTIPLYIEKVRESCGELETLRGEMRSSQDAPLLPGVLSTRMWIKQQNATTEHLLEQWMEPLTVWAWKLGFSYTQGLIRMAWRYLLQNHPHDSICGCSIDQVHRENSVRFTQSQQIAENVIAQALQQLASVTDTRAPLPAPHSSAEPVPILVFNPASGPRAARAQAVVQLPGSLYNAVIIDERGERMPYRIVNRWRQELGSMPFAREMLAAAIALAGVDSPAQLLQMAQTMLASMLGLPEDASVISRIYIEDYTSSPIHHVHHTPQSSVVYIEIMIAPRGRIAVNEDEILAAGQQLLELVKREDIHTLEISVVDQARETIEFVAADLPGHGLKTFWLYPRGVKDGSAALEIQNVQRGQREPPLLAQQNSIENEFYRVEVDKRDGTLKVTDKQTGVVFAGLNRFIDGGDVGDLYTYTHPEHDVLVSEPQEQPRIELINTGPVRATLRITGRWTFPSSCTANRSERSSRMVSCSITSEVSLVPGVRRVDIHTSLENRAKDHRLRVLFPVPYTVAQASSEGTFEVRTRPSAQEMPAGVAEWVEMPVNTFPQKRFVDVSNGELGLGVLNRGLPEYEMVNGEASNSAVALTLLRCVEWLSRGDLPNRRGHAGPMEQTPEAQCLGHHEFDYALVPHRGDWQVEEALVLREAQAFNLPIDAHAVVTEVHEGRLPSHAELVSVEPRELVVSAIKRACNGQGVVVRIYNPLQREVEASVCPGFTFTHVYRANLLEEPDGNQADLQAENQTIRVALRATGILTLIFE